MVAMVLVGYLLIGCGLVIFGPGREEIARQVADVRGSELANAITGRPKVPEGKVLAFRIIMTVAIIMAWPIFVASCLKAKRTETREQKKWEAYVQEGIRFEMMGGAGTVHCNDCQFSERITSFMHGRMVNGADCCTTGYQCLSCGRFVALRSEESPMGDDTPCQCGGALSREHVLFCPRCRSKNLAYRVSVIS